MIVTVTMRGSDVIYFTPKRYEKNVAAEWHHSTRILSLQENLCNATSSLHVKKNGLGPHRTANINRGCIDGRKKEKNYHWVYYSDHVPKTDLLSWMEHGTISVFRFPHN